MNTITNGSLLITGLSSLLSTSASLLIAGQPATSVADHIARSLIPLREESNSVPLRALIGGLQEVTDARPSTESELAEGLYQVGQVLTAITNDSWCRDSLGYSMRNLAQIIQASDGEARGAGGLFRKDVVRDAAEEERWRMLAPLLAGVYHDTAGIIAGLDAMTPILSDEAERIVAVTGANEDTDALTAVSAELVERIAEVFKALPSIRIAVYLSGARRAWRGMMNEPFTNGDIDLLARTMDGMRAPLQRITGCIGRIVRRFESRRLAGVPDGMPADLRKMGRHFRGSIQLVGTSVELLTTLKAMHAGLGETLRIPVSLHDSLNPAMIQSVLGKRISLSLNLEPDPGPVLGPACHIQQILYNLIVNAQDAIKGRGFVTVATRRIRVENEAAGEEPGDYMELSVKDTGTGIPEGLLPRIFEAGLSGKGSSGLGLYVVHEIVRSMGGFIRVTTSTDPELRGTTFSISLPIRTAT